MTIRNQDHYPPLHRLA